MKIFDTLKFTQDWIALGIISPEKLRLLETEWLTGEDSNTEHYRWRAFRDFMDNHEFLEPEILKRLYRLGQEDVDPLMGGSMMVEVLNRKECPMDLLNAAANSIEKFLQRTAIRKLGQLTEK